MGAWPLVKLVHREKTDRKLVGGGDVQRIKRGFIGSYLWAIGGLLVGIFSEQWVLKDIPWIPLHEHHAFQ